MKPSIALGMLSFAGLFAAAAHGVRSVPSPAVALERRADDPGTVDDDGEARLRWRGRYSPAEDRDRLRARIDRGPARPVTLEGLDGVSLPPQPLAPGLHFVELSVERRGGRVTRITDEVLAGPWQAERERGCDLALTLTAEGLHDLLVPVVEAKLLAGARGNEYFGRTSVLTRKELEVVDGGLRFDVALDTSEEGKGDLTVAGIIDVRGDGDAGVVASLRRLERAAPGPKLEALARAEGSRKLGGIGALVLGGLAVATGGGALVGLTAAAGGGYLGAKIGEDVGERRARREVRREAQEQIERALKVATDALRLPDGVTVLPTEPALRADLRWCDAPRLEANTGLRAQLRVALHVDEAGRRAARQAVHLGAELPRPRAPARPEANVHVDVSADFVNRLLAEWVTRGGLQASLDRSGLRQELQGVLGDRTRWRVEALRVERPPMLWPRADGRIDATVGGVILELLDPERGVERTVVLGGTGDLTLRPEPTPGRLRLGGGLEAVYFGCREREGALERRLPCFSAAVDPELLRDRFDEQLRERSDALPVLDLGAALRLRVFSEPASASDDDGARALGPRTLESRTLEPRTLEPRTLELVGMWVTAENGLVAIDARVR